MRDTHWHFLHHWTVEEPQKSTLRWLQSMSNMYNYKQTALIKDLPSSKPSAMKCAKPLCHNTSRHIYNAKTWVTELAGTPRTGTVDQAGYRKNNSRNNSRRCRLEQTQWYVWPVAFMVSSLQKLCMSLSLLLLPLSGWFGNCCLLWLPILHLYGTESRWLLSSVDVENWIFIKICLELSAAEASQFRTGIWVSANSYKLSTLRLQ